MWCGFCTAWGLATSPARPFTSTAACMCRQASSACSRIVSGRIDRLRGRQGSSRALHCTIRGGIDARRLPLHLEMEHMLLFKYVSPDAVARVLERDGALDLRFGLPKTYNDPYELFLEPDPPLESEDQRAFYDYFLGKVVQAPVACFSRRPDSVVMWAHYGRDGAGACLAFDEDALVDQFPVAYVGDVDYVDEPATVDAGLVHYAFTTGKRRHTVRLLAIAHRAAYFIKRTDWQYEAERRIVVTPDVVENRSGVLIGRVAPVALRHIILGPNVDDSVRQLCETRARQYLASSLQLRIGIRTYTPFFVGTDATAVVWADGRFETVDEVCSRCGEPAASSEDGVCQWCGISEEARDSAPRRSMLTATLHYGIDKGLPFVFDGMEPRGHLVKESRLKPEGRET